MKPTAMRKVCLLGAAFDTGNMGVSALATAFFTIFKTLHDGAELFLLAWRHAPATHELNVHGYTCSVKIINCRMSPRSSLNQHIFWILILAGLFRFLPFDWIRRRVLKENLWLRTVHEADFIGSIHGGDSFSDIYGLSRLIYGVLTDLSVLLMAKKLVLLPQTYGPYQGLPARWLAKIVMRYSSAILSRDLASLDTVREILRHDTATKHVGFCPDVAFMLPALLPILPEIKPTLPAIKDFPLIGINVSGLLYNGGYSRNNMFGLKLDYRQLIEDAVRRFMEASSAHVLLLPHTFAPSGDVESDPDACAAIQDLVCGNFPGRVHRVAVEYGPTELKGLISLCDFFIGSRMHACIGALSLGIATVGIAYSRKFAGVFESVSEGALVVDARAVDLNTAVSMIMHHFADRHKFKNFLNLRLLGLRREIMETFQVIAISGEIRQF
jgi:polysaccharide pyruvyl transferase WcaK-like protein